MSAPSVYIEDNGVARIEIDGAASDAMRAHAVRDYPHECCGALFGTETGSGRVVVTIMEIDNVSDDDRRRRFSIAPMEYLRAEREAERRGLRLLGFYHSHPDHPARPSETDRAFAQVGFSYPILSVIRGEVIDLTSWRIRTRDAAYDREEVVIIDDRRIEQAKEHSLERS